jgi:imidazolonepropionase-like amidohydrolase
MLNSFIRFLGSGLLSVLLLATAEPAQSPATASTSTLALVNATVIDGNGGAPLPQMTVLISNARIVDLFATGKKKLPAGATVLDLTGRTLIPGLIDAHVHIANSLQPTEARDRMLRFALRGGLTTVRDMGGDAIALAEMARAANDSAAQSPRIFFSAMMGGPTLFSDPRMKTAPHGATPGEVAWLRAITPQTDISKAVADAKATGATGLKVYADLPADLVTKITAEAHRQGMKVWSHATIFPAKPSDAVAAGVDSLSHSAYLVWEGVSTVPNSYRERLKGDYKSVPVTSEAITALLGRMKANGTVLDATLFIFDSFTRTAQPPPGVRDLKQLVNWTFEVTKRAHALGVAIVAGTDSMGRSDRDEFPNLHTELDLLVQKCELTPLEAITAATRTAAQVLGIQNAYGTIAKGKIADLVVLSDDPSRDIRNTKKIVYIIKGGSLYKRT